MALQKDLCTNNCVFWIQSNHFCIKVEPPKTSFLKVTHTPSSHTGTLNGLGKSFGEVRAPLSHLYNSGPIWFLKVQVRSSLYSTCWLNAYHVPSPGLRADNTKVRSGGQSSCFQGNFSLVENTNMVHVAEYLAHSRSTQ